MKRKITEAEIAYLLEHLEDHYQGVSLSEYLSVNAEEQSHSKPCIHIPLSSSDLDLKKVVELEGLPVLFPVENKDGWYHLEDKKVVFHHDILKSAFYLLSAYQEYHGGEQDELGRYPWTSSIQHRLQFTDRPLVNEYFEIILEAIEHFCKLNQLAFSRTPPASPVLFLSHDVDRINKYSLRNTLYLLMVALGIKSSTLDKHTRQALLRQTATGTFLSKKDPYWNFKDLQEVEKNLGIRSTWFLLEKTRLDNSKYLFSDKKIRKLIRDLEDHGHEIGIHGTLESSSDATSMDESLQRLNTVTRHPVSGNRQHYLKYDNPGTAEILDRSGLSYDATMGFAEHIGFRHSYCHPYRLFDFEKQKARKTVQLPLVVMEVSLLDYMKIPHDQGLEFLQPILDQIRRHKGIFGLLWHNCQLDEEYRPGINSTYRSILSYCLDSGFEALTGSDIYKAYREDQTFFMKR